MSTMAEAGVPDLVSIRAEIEAVDDELVALIGRRCRLAAAAGVAKAVAGLPAADLKREAAVLRHAAAKARAERINEETTRRIFWHLIELGRGAQAWPGAHAS